MVNEIKNRRSFHAGFKFTEMFHILHFVKYLL
jgi:hypothetical protein